MTPLPLNIEHLKRAHFLGGNMGFDLLEDILAFLYATGADKPRDNGEPHYCDKCGAELEGEENGGETRCPECGEGED